MGVPNGKYYFLEKNNGHTWKENERTKYKAVSHSGVNEEI